MQQLRYTPKQHALHIMEILALHGFTGCGRDFDPFAEMCSGIWTSPDLPGHGESGSIHCGADSTIRFIEAKRQRLTGIPNILIGYSMGVRAALNHAVHHPESWDGLVLISANPGIEHEVDRRQRRSSDDQLANRIETHGVQEFLYYWQNLPIIATQKNIDSKWLAKMDRSRLKHTPAGLAASLRQFGQGICQNLWPELGALQMPILILSGQTDTKYTEIGKRLTGVLANSEHREIPQAGHMPHLENPIESSSVINRFLERFE